MEIEIEEDDLAGFNVNAHNELKKAAKEYIDDVIEESNRIESARNSTSNNPEITSSMVNDAKILIRRGLSQPKKKIGVRIVRIVGAILSVVSGVLYDSTKLQDSWYMVLFIGVITATILTVTISTIKE